MPAWEAPLVDHHTVGLHCDSTGEEDLQVYALCHPPMCILPRCRRTFLASSGMAERVLHCECGFEASASSEDALVAVVQRHAREAHGMALSHDEALLLAFRAELSEGSPLSVPKGETKEGGQT